MTQALVLGAGISGLAAARRLRRRGFEVTVLEAADRPGGMLRTRERGGFRAEVGPSMIPDSRDLQELCADAGCEDDLVRSSRAAKKAYLVHRGRLVALPSSPAELLRTPLLSSRGKLRLMAEPLQGRGPGPHETVADFFARRFGQEVAEIAAVMAIGAFGGDYRELVIGDAAPEIYETERRHGSLLKRMTSSRDRGQGNDDRYRGLVTFRHGFEALAARLAEGLDVRYETAAARVEHASGGFRVAAFGAGDQEAAFAAERLVVALPPTVAARVLEPLGDTRRLAALVHAPLVSLALSYTWIRRTADAYGFLVPPKERCRLLGCFFTSTLFPHTAPTGSTLLTVTLGGRLEPELVDEDEDVLVRLAEKELRRLLGIGARPELIALRRWTPGIPQPTATIGPARRQVDRLCQQTRGLDVIGNWIGGANVADCIRGGWRLG